MNKKSKTPSREIIQQRQARLYALIEPLWAIKKAKGLCVLAFADDIGVAHTTLYKLSRRKLTRPRESTVAVFEAYVKKEREFAITAEE
jgi:hypothetical protein